MTDEELVNELALVLRRQSGTPAERYARALKLLRTHVEAVRTETATRCAELLTGWGEVCAQRKRAIEQEFNLAPATEQPREGAEEESGG